jgi:hypothetical protein
MDSSAEMPSMLRFSSNAISQPQPLIRIRKHNFSQKRPRATHFVRDPNDFQPAIGGHFTIKKNDHGGE